MAGLPGARFAEYVITGPSGGFYTLYRMTNDGVLTNTDLLTGVQIPVPADPVLGGSFVKVQMLGGSL